MERYVITHQEGAQEGVKVIHENTKGDKRKFRNEDLILKVTANIDPKKVTREAVFHGKDVNYDEIDRLQHRFHQALGRRPSEEWATG